MVEHKHYRLQGRKNAAGKKELVPCSSKDPTAFEADFLSLPFSKSFFLSKCDTVTFPDLQEAVRERSSSVSVRKLKMYRMYESNSDIFDIYQQTV